MSSAFAGNQNSMEALQAQAQTLSATQEQLNQRLELQKQLLERAQQAQEAGAKATENARAALEDARRELAEYKEYGDESADALQEYADAVTAAGADSLFGGTVVVVYRNVLLERERRVADVTCRCCHLSKVLAKPGQAVRAGDVIGVQGNTGAYQARMGVHLHIEFDRDTAHPCHVPGIAKDGNIIKRGTDSTLDPADVFHRGPGQSARSVSYAGWTTEKDWTYSEV